MKSQRISLATALVVVSMGSAGCAHDRSRDSRTAEADVTRARVDAQRDLARLDAEHAREQREAQEESQSAAERSRLFEEQKEEKSEAKGKASEDIKNAEVELAETRGVVSEDRETFRKDSRARLDRAKARASEKERKRGALDSKERSEFDREWRDYSARRVEVEQALTRLSRAKDSEWDAVRQRVDRDLDALEKAVDELGD
jgi:hypothetical protein